MYWILKTDRQFIPGRELCSVPIIGVSWVCLQQQPSVDRAWRRWQLYQVGRRSAPSIIFSRGFAMWLTSTYRACLRTSLLLGILVHSGQCFCVAWVDLASIVSVDRSFQVFLVEGLVVVHARYLIPQSENAVVLDWRQIARAAFSFINSKNAAWAGSSRRWFQPV